MTIGPRAAWLGSAAMLLALWAAASSVAILAVGDAYRRGLPREAVAVAKSVRDPDANPKARPSSGKPRGEDSNGTDVALPPMPKPATVKNPEGPAKAPATSTTAAAEISDQPISRPGSKDEVAQVDPFWREPGQSKTWDLDHLTADGERELGASIHNAILRFNPPVEDGPLPKRVEDAAEPYLKFVDRKDVKYTFTVLDCPDPNAFSVPGGYVYVCRGLFDWIAEDEDYALEFAVAHEIAHVDKAHAIACLRDPEVKKLKLSTSLLFYSIAIPWGYLEAQDLEADRWAWERMGKLGRSRYEGFSFLRRLEDYARKNGFENVRKKPIDKPLVPVLDNHLRAHPIPRNRLKALSNLTTGPREP